MTGRALPASRTEEVLRNERRLASGVQSGQDEVFMAAAKTPEPGLLST
jgi:hypothetical protein